MSGHKKSAPKMLQLSTDQEFHFEILRAVSLAPYQGADVGEVLVAANKIEPGNFESYYAAFYELASRVQQVADKIDPSKYPVSARHAYFRVANYLRSADFFLHGNWEDKRINDLWRRHVEAFDKAIALLPVPGERVTLQARNFKIPAVFYGCGLPGRRPTVIVCNGFDGSQEELYHVIIEAVLLRGWNAISYEGPGQPTVRREQNLGFFGEWEEVLTPVVDYALTREEVDPEAIGSWGYSLGGYLVGRAAAFEHRCAAIMALDGVYDFGAGVLKTLPPPLRAAFESGDEVTFNQAIEKALANPAAPTSFRWSIEHGLWAYNTKSPFDFLSRCQSFSLAEILHQIKTPVFSGDAEDDELLPGEGKVLAEKLGDLATYHFSPRRMVRESIVRLARRCIRIKLCLTGSRM
ncbi:20-hydroxy-prefusarin hydrolase FUS2 [Cladobotryum mycophilum]|uniref:20-hydroxy-prefusarin hydrolase FUS2 n=1 Tax=Cladobotryum mycophilum TaxID=491253 RepID=A0ABR0SN42_9HYPO